jgi:hypothetical protein
VVDRLTDFQQAGVGVIAVSMSNPESIARYLDGHPHPIAVLADPERNLYSALGLGRTSWARLLRPNLVWRYLRLMARGGKVRRVPAGEDALQLGGDFLIDHDRQLLWAHRGADPTDRPTVDAILDAVHRLAVT